MDLRKVGCVDGSESGLCPMAGFGVNSVEALGSYQRIS